MNKFTSRPDVVGRLALDEVPLGESGGGVTDRELSSHRVEETTKKRKILVARSVVPGEAVVRAGEGPVIVPTGAITPPPDLPGEAGKVYFGAETPIRVGSPPHWTESSVPVTVVQRQSDCGQLLVDEHGRVLRHTVVGEAALMDSILKTISTEDNRDGDVGGMGAPAEGGDATSVASELLREDRPIRLLKTKAARAAERERVAGQTRLPPEVEQRIATSRLTRAVREAAMAEALRQVKTRESVKEQVLMLDKTREGERRNEQRMKEQMNVHEWTKFRREERALENHQKRVQQWESLQKRLSEKFGRPVNDLVLERVHGFYGKKRERVVIEDAAPLEYGDVSAFWRPPKTVGSRLNELTVSESRKTVTVRPHIGFPSSRSISHAPIEKTLDRTFVEYMDNRRKELRRALNYIDPFVPDFAGLEVVGERVFDLDAMRSELEDPYDADSIIHAAKRRVRAAKKASSQSSSVGSDVSAAEMRKLKKADDAASVGSGISINDLEEEEASSDTKSDEYDDEPKSYETVISRVSGPSLWFSEHRLLFTTEVGELQRRKLRIVNRGSTVIVYRWKKPVDGCSSFFFLETEGTLLPGEEHDFLFMFRSSIPGLFYEKWVLETSPRLSSRVCGSVVSASDAEWSPLAVMDVSVDRGKGEEEKEDGVFSTNGEIDLRRKWFPAFPLLTKGCCVLGDRYAEHRCQVEFKLEERQLKQFALSIIEDLLTAVVERPVEEETNESETMALQFFEKYNASKGLFYTPVMFSYFCRVARDIRNAIVGACPSEYKSKVTDVCMPGPAFTSAYGVLLQRPSAQAQGCTAACTDEGVQNLRAIRAICFKGDVDQHEHYNPSWDVKPDPLPPMESEDIGTFEQRLWSGDIDELFDWVRLVPDVAERSVLSMRLTKLVEQASQAPPPSVAPGAVALDSTDIKLTPAKMSERQWAPYMNSLRACVVRDMFGEVASFVEDTAQHLRTSMMLEPKPFVAPYDDDDVEMRDVHFVGVIKEEFDENASRRSLQTPGRNWNSSLGGTSKRQVGIVPKKPMVQPHGGTSRRSIGPGMAKPPVQQIAPPSTPPTAAPAPVPPPAPAPAPAVEPEPVAEPVHEASTNADTGALTPPGDVGGAEADGKPAADADPVAAEDAKATPEPKKKKKGARTKGGRRKGSPRRGRSRSPRKGSRSPTKSKSPTKGSSPDGSPVRKSKSPRKGKGMRGRSPSTKMDQPAVPPPPPSVPVAAEDQVGIGAGDAGGMTGEQVPVRYKGGGYAPDSRPNSSMLPEQASIPPVEDIVEPIPAENMEERYNLALYERVRGIISAITDRMILLTGPPKRHAAPTNRITKDDMDDADYQSDDDGY